MTQSYDPSTGTSTWDLGATRTPELEHPNYRPAYYSREAWDEHWDNWAKNAIASGSLVPPDEDMRRPGNVLATAFLIAIVMLIGIGPVAY